MSLRTGWVAALGLLVASYLLVFGAGLRASPGAPQDRKTKFEIYPDAKKEYRWRYKAANGEISATSGQGYKSKSSCQDAVDKLKAGAGADKYKFEVYEDNAKKFRFRMIASNGQTVGSSSQGYKAKTDCEHAIELLKTQAKSAKVEVLSE